MIDAFQIMKWPMLACLLLSPLLVYLGLHVVRREIIFVDLAQGVALGSCVALLLGHDAHDWPTLAWSLAFTIAGAISFTLTRTKNHRVPQEASVGFVYVVAAPVGILLPSRSPHGGEELRRTLVGDLLLVRPEEIGKTFAVFAVIGVIHYAFRHPLLALSYGPAEPRGVRRWDFVFYLLFGLVVTGFVQIGGVLLTFSYLIVPAVWASFLAESIGVRLLVGGTVATLAGGIGLFGSYQLDLSTGAAVVWGLGLALILVALARTLWRRKLPACTADTKPRLGYPRTKGEVMRSCWLLSALIVALVLAGPPALRAQSETRDGAFIHISHGTDDPHRVLMALRMAEIMSEDKDGLIYFDIKAIEVVRKDAPVIQFKEFPSAHTQLKKWAERPVTVMACPGCLKAAGKTPEDLASGIQIADKNAFFSFTRGRILSLDD